MKGKPLLTVCAFLLLFSIAGLMCPCHVHAVSGSVSGSTATSSGALSGVTIGLYYATDGSAATDASGNYALAVSDSSGAYSIANLNPNDYKVKFSKTGFATQWYSGANTVGTAATVTVAGGTNTPNINATLQTTGSISGKVSTNGGTGPSGVTIGLYYASDGSAVTHDDVTNPITGDASGNYTFTGVTHGDYKVKFSKTGYETQWYSGATTIGAATTVTVAGGATTPGINGTLQSTSPPTIAKAFGAASIPLNGTTGLTFTITNPNSSTTLTGIAFTDTLPAGLAVATPNGLTGPCGGGTITADQGTGVVSLSGASMAAGGSCGFSVNVTGTSLGVKNNTVLITSAEAGAGNTANSSITVLPQTIYAIPGGATSGFCESWANGCELRYALANAVTGQEIWVKTGSYTPTATTDRTATFQLVSGVALYGGFAGSETLRSQRDFSANVTTLSGDLLGDDGANFTNRHDNSIHVVAGANSATLDGFIVSGGAADGSGSGPDAFGGGMYNDNVSPTVTNCIFSGNLGNNGAGMANINGSSTTVTNCTFSGNLADNGAGMLNLLSSPTVTNCTFSDNQGGYGSAMTNYQASPTVTNCTFGGNSSVLGGAMYNDAAAPVLTNCSFSGNSASSSGGAMYNTDVSNPVIRNSILWDDSPGNDEIHNDSGAPTVSYSIIQGGYSGAGNSSTDPLLGALANYGGVTRTMPILPGSPAIDAGNAATCAATDQRGLARAGACDIGAFESQGFTLAKTGGDSQSTLISTSFASPLALTVTASNAGEPVNGGFVTFTAPGTGASTNPASTAATIAGGAVSFAATANGTAGSFNVVAGTAGATSVSFTLANVAPALLTINFAGNGGNKVESTFPDQSINCLKGGSSGCSASYASGTAVTLKATPDWKSTFIGWSGDYSSSDNPGMVTMTADKTVTATFDPIYKVRLMPNALFASIQEAYASVPSGSLTIQAQTWSFLEDLLFSNGTAVTLTGGMDESYNPTTGYATVKSLTVGMGSAVIGNISIK